MPIDVTQRCWASSQRKTKINFCSAKVAECFAKKNSQHTAIKQQRKVTEQNLIVLSCKTKSMTNVIILRFYTSAPFTYNIFPIFFMLIFILLLDRIFIPSVARYLPPASATYTSNNIAGAVQVCWWNEPCFIIYSSRIEHVNGDRQGRRHVIFYSSPT